MHETRDCLYEFFQGAVNDKERGCCIALNGCLLVRLGVLLLFTESEIVKLWPLFKFRSVPTIDTIDTVRVPLKSQCLQATLIIRVINTGGLGYTFWSVKNVKNSGYMNIKMA